MFCPECGSSIPDNAMFCGKCGQALKGKTQLEQQSTETYSVQPDGNSAASFNSREIPDRKKALYAIIAGVALIAVVGIFFGGRAFSEARAYKKILSNAEKAASTEDYSRAISLYHDALAEKPDDQAALDGLDSTISVMLAKGLDRAKALVADGNIDDALRELENLPVPSEAKQYSEYQDHIRALNTRPYVVAVDSYSFPSVFVYVYTENSDAELGSVSITDGGKTAVADDISTYGNEMVISYTAEESPDGGEERDVSLSLTIGAFSFPLGGNYITPVLQDAALTLVSTDFSEYPLVHAFFRVRDMFTGQHVANVGPNSFKISESVSGGAYVAREVKSAEPITNAGGEYGINISLVADKSDSIGSDMAKIKTVMREFVGSISLTSGDRAELIAFDDVPQIMCTFTNDEVRLNNGINNMSLDGMTAFYDAVYQGARDAALQGGARCVIAFTDGEDNRSRFTANDVIRYASGKQVPLYIIGVGNKYSSSHDTMRMMANETQGHYWYIDDLYDLQEIYAQIYSELQELYVVTYESDEGADPFSDRGLQVSMHGGGYKGSANANFSPAKTAGGGSGSRYEIFLEDVSWEEANERCLERGGHLVTITSKDEEDQIIALAENADAKYVWIGGYTSHDSYDDVFAHWITGEDFTYNNWMKDEPSRKDMDGTPEWYLMLWNIPDSGGWCWNDQRNELISVLSYYEGNIAYVCEYE